MSASRELIAELETKLEAAAQGLPDLTSKKMFGCFALWARGNVFALVWKHGRLGVKLPAPAPYAQALGLKGASPWKAGPMQMAHWVLLPEPLHAGGAELRKWVREAHALCSKLEPKGKAPKPAKKAPAKKAPAKKAPAKKAPAKAAAKAEVGSKKKA